MGIATGAPQPFCYKAWYHAVPWNVNVTILSHPPLSEPSVSMTSARNLVGKVRVIGRTAG